MGDAGHVVARHRLDFGDHLVDGEELGIDQQTIATWRQEGTI